MATSGPRSQSVLGICAAVPGYWNSWRQTYMTSVDAASSVEWCNWFRVSGLERLMLVSGLLSDAHWTSKAGVAVIIEPSLCVRLKYVSHLSRSLPLDAVGRAALAMAVLHLQPSGRTLLFCPFSRPSWNSSFLRSPFSRSTRNPKIAMPLFCRRRSVCTHFAAYKCNL